MRKAVVIGALWLGGASALMGCGDEDLPSGVVAKVDGHAITASALAHAVVGREALSRSASKAPTYRPPDDFDACAATSIEDAKSRALSRQEAKRRCAAQRGRARAAALRLLIRGRWYALEAGRRRIQVPDALRLPLTRAGLRTGAKPADVEDVAEAQSLRLLLLQRALSKPATFSQDEIARFFEAHEERYVWDARRYVDALVAPTRALARRLVTEFRRGPTSAELMRDFGKAGVTRPYDGNLQDSSATGRAALHRLALTLGKGDAGMVKDPRGWYVFRVGAAVPRMQATLEGARSNVEQDLQFRRGKEIVSAYHERLRSRYRDATVCADGYEIPECE